MKIGKLYKVRKSAVSIRLLSVDEKKDVYTYELYVRRRFVRVDSMSGDKFRAIAAKAYEDK